MGLGVSVSASVRARGAWHGGVRGAIERSSDRAIERLTDGWNERVAVLPAHPTGGQAASNRSNTYCHDGDAHLHVIQPMVDAVPGLFQELD